MRSEEHETQHRCNRFLEHNRWRRGFLEGYHNKAWWYFRKRKKKLSRKVYGTSHLISKEEAKHIFDKGAERIIIGSGQEGMVKLSEKASAYFSKKECEVELMPTPEAIKQWNEAKGKVIGLFHLTCWEDLGCVGYMHIMFEPFWSNGTRMFLFLRAFWNDFQSRKEVLGNDLILFMQKYLGMNNIGIYSFTTNY